MENRQLRFDNDDEYQRPRCSLADDYHGGSEGLELLTASDLSDAGFQDIDSARPILEVHRVLLRTWIDSRGNEGPNQKKLASKDYMSKLKDTSVYDVFTFHSNLVNASLNYNVALVPFDSIEINFGAIGLCPPGLGKKCSS